MEGVSSEPSEDEQRRLDAYLSLSRLERGLRRFLEQELSRLHGERWVRALPNDVKAKVEAADLEHIDFPDLKKTLGANWRHLQIQDAPEKRHALSHLEGLEPIRNDIAHSRNISEGALSVVQAAIHILTPLFEPTARGERSLPATNHPRLALVRLRAAMAADVSVSMCDVATLEQESAYRPAAEAIQAYVRVRSRPGRRPDLLRATKQAAEEKVTETLRDIERRSGCS